MQDNNPSILDFLTRKNPIIEYDRKRIKGSNTGSSTLAGAGYLSPTTLLPWEDFTFETLQKIFDGELYTLATGNSNTLFSFPNISKRTDLLVRCENSTRHVLTKWNHSIVQSALDVLPSKYNACDWSPYPGRYATENLGDRAHDNHMMRLFSPVANPNRNNKPEHYIRGSRVVPDAGTIRRCPINGPSCRCSLVERLPKEYKPFPKFDSTDLDNLLDGKGNLDEESRNRNNVLPIRQAFTYCIRRGCRYGCVLTTREAFIFRIQLLGPLLEHNVQDIPPGTVIDSILHYASIPWSETSSGGLTFNLALWFVHILAGNSYRLDYRPYNSLVDEKLGDLSCLLPVSLDESASLESDGFPTVSRNTSKKRKLYLSRDDSDSAQGEDEDEDQDPGQYPDFSFSNDPEFGDLRPPLQSQKATSNDESQSRPRSWQQEELPRAAKPMTRSQRSKKQKSRVVK